MNLIMEGFVQGEFMFLRISTLAFVAALLLVACGGGQDASQPASSELRLKSGGLVPAVSMTMPDERGNYGVSKSGAGFVLRKLSDGIAVDVSRDVTRVHFQDQSLAFDIDKGPGQLYRLYQAAFDRTPDLGGMGFWLNAVDNGMPLTQVAELFIASAEFLRLNGEVSDTAFIGKLYAHVLHRQPDEGGLGFWLNALKAGKSRSQLLGFFSESPENTAAVAPSIALGVAYADVARSYRPVAIAGADQSVMTGAKVALNGGASWGTSGNALRYTWVLSVPVGSRAALSSSSLANPTLQTDLNGVYIGALTVVDGNAVSTVSSTYVVASPAVIVPVVDSGRFKCTEISHSLALTLFAAGHTYLDRDHDGKACEATDLSIERTPPLVVPVVPPVVIAPPVVGPKQCWVSAYTKKNGTHVRGYWRSC